MALNRRRKPPFESIVVVSCIHDAIFIGGNHRNVNESIGLLACLWSTNAQNSWRWDGANQRLSIVAMLCEGLIPLAIPELRAPSTLMYAIA
jgi:hypothetical protein